MVLSVGMKAPDFSLPDEIGQIHQLSDLIGKWVIIYFYPKDDTPGCTTEACSFRDSWGIFQKQGIMVLGISKDSISSHQKFHDKYKLPFPILSDTTHKSLSDYSAWGEKKFMGKTIIGTKRMTYIINPQGNIAKIYSNVNPKSHSEEILKDIIKLQ
jgi:thioredoxin-dependent peroxiredoxin